ncbi:MAG: glutathione S-transferase family protein [Hyphomonadaceae bacterium]|nr:glutathione S-transferase family protein [Hyphomonadaceae bacterium]
MMELYHNDLSICAQKVRLALAEKGLAFESRHLDLKIGESHSPDYLKLNPKGVVPTLVDRGRPIGESTIINEYLDEAYPEHPLRPADLLERTDMRRWVMLTDTGLSGACGLVSFAIAFRHEYTMAPTWKAPEKRAARAVLIEKGLEHPGAPQAVLAYDQFLSDLARQLDQSPWIAGRSFSLAEAALIPYVRRLEDMALAWMWEEAKDRASITRWYAACKARPGFRGISDWAPQALHALMKEKGLEARPRMEELLRAARAPS